MRTLFKIYSTKGREQLFFLFVNTIAYYARNASYNPAHRALSDVLMTIFTLDMVVGVPDTDATNSIIWNEDEKISLTQLGVTISSPS
jgi:hypothetical protein